MGDDFIRRLSQANGQLVRHLAWSIENKQFDCVAQLQPIAQALATVLTDMINNQNDILTRRGKIKLVKKAANELNAVIPSNSPRINGNGQRPEILLHKADIDRTFSFNRNQWSQFAPQMIVPGWTLNFVKHATGKQIMGFDPFSGVGLSFQPFFTTETSVPIKLAVGNYFPLGMLPAPTVESKLLMEIAAQKELGEAYALKLVHLKMDNLEMFEFVISEL